ncbi:hypothetical protein M514_04474 [Trichuris suis]|uniref:Peptidase aspartic putative domain-containing protein n=1 Tax=Trichuris suis TaxID=68888 RepID=A0A085MVG9_9BILA|nr:hypothetical protein M514_04474 [Trichuris suis]
MAEADRKNAAEGNSNEVIEAVNHLTTQLTVTLTSLIDSLRKELAAARSESRELPRKQGDTSVSNTIDAQPPSTVVATGNVDDWIFSVDMSANIASSVPASWLADFAPAVKIEQFDGNPLHWDMFIGSFKSLVHDVVPSNSQRIAILRQLLSPELRASVAPSLSSPDMYGQALRDLRRLFGSPSVVVGACIRKLRTIEPIQPRGCNVELQSLATLQGVVQKLPRSLQEKWAKKTFHLSPGQATLENLDQWLEELVVVNRTLEPVELCDDLGLGPRASYHRMGRKVTVTAQKKGIGLLSSEEKSRSCALCEKEHILSACPQFREATPVRRAEIAKELQQCFACLSASHRARFCPSKVSCGVDGCKQRHHRLLHGSPRVWPEREKKVVASQKASFATPSMTVGANVAKTRNDDGFCQSVVPVIVSRDVRSVSTYALRKPCDVQLSTFHGKDPQFELTSVSFNISGSDGQAHDIGKALVVPMLNLSHRSVNWSKEKLSYSHLKDLPLSKVDYGKVHLLIGADNFNVIQPLEIRKPSAKKQPFDMRTPLGWVVVGPTPSLGHNALCSINNINRLGSQDNDEIMDLLERFWSTESFGTKPNVQPPRR